VKPLLDDHDAEEMDDRTDLVPLIDCVFLVLLFYVVAATFSEESIFPVQLPRTASETATTVAPASETLTVWVAADGAFAVEKERVAPLELGRVLREKVTAAKPRTLIIRGDRRAPYERVATALELAQSLGIEDISLAVEKPETPGATP